MDRPPGYKSVATRCICHSPFAKLPHQLPTSPPDLCTPPCPGEGMPVASHHVRDTVLSKSCVRAMRSATSAEKNSHKVHHRVSFLSSCSSPFTTVGAAGTADASYAARRGHRPQQQSYQNLSCWLSLCEAFAAATITCSITVLRAIVADACAIAHAHKWRTVPGFLHFVI